MIKQSYLTLAPLTLTVHLGHLAVERKTAQTVTADIKIKLATIPNACHSDDLADTLCYHQLTLVLENCCQQRQFRLIEALTQQLYDEIRNFSPLIAMLSVTVTKNPPLENLQRCAFTLSDWE
ncbi:MAG: dihydroneopterin aldolase [Gammaproteobacteria bacterium]|nr:dihydroneopterin aldolase [Gammaproteobacteria bacterium]